jgi:thiol-disulfide isomerase/thioredoxin
MTAPGQRPLPNRDDVRLSELRGSRGGSRLSRTQLLVSLAIVAAIVGGAWLAGGRLGLADLGSGGVARQYLPRVGEEVPSLGMYGPDGRAVYLSQFEGQPVWINFWGSWCPPCQAEFPDIEAAYQALQPQGVQLLAISVREDLATAQAFATANGGTFPVYNIPNISIFGDTWDVRNYPTHLYIDAEGIVRYISTSPGKAPDLIARGEWLAAGDWDAVAARPATDLVADRPRRVYA